MSSQEYNYSLQKHCFQQLFDFVTFPAPALENISIPAKHSPHQVSALKTSFSALCATHKLNFKIPNKQ